MITKFKRVIVGVSGGVDSAVSALLLKNKGYDVQGCFMQNWDIADEQGQCSASEDFKDAQIVCDKLEIKLHYVNFVKYYWNYVFRTVSCAGCNQKEYQMGYTPNPDILCNKYIKFDCFFKYAIENLGADAIATGHYANTSFGPYLEEYDPDKRVKLLKAFNTNKDQTFFLSQIRQESLRKTMFPLGLLLKSKVRDIAIENKLTNVANKKESMGICFIGSRDFKSFISEYIEDKPGHFIDIKTNEIKGMHNGLHHYTIGQRSGLHSNKNTSYVARKDYENNNIYVTEGWHSFPLYTDLFQTSEPHWIDTEPRELQKNNVLICDFKFQHVETLRKVWVFKTKQGLIVSLEEALRCITAGQYAVFYKNKECLGSARIIHPGICKYFIHKYNVENDSHTTVKTKQKKVDIKDVNFKKVALSVS